MSSIVLGNPSEISRTESPAEAGALGDKLCCLPRREADERETFERAGRRAANVIGGSATVFNHAIDRVRKYNPRKVS